MHGVSRRHDASSSPSRRPWVRSASLRSRLDAICARSPTLGFVVELTGVLPFIGFFIALAVAFVPIPRKHDYEDFQQIQLPSVNGSMEFMHLVIGNSIERAWAPWLPWTGFRGLASRAIGKPAPDSS